MEEEASPIKGAFKPSGAAVPDSEDIISVTRERNLLRDQLLRVCIIPSLSPQNIMETDCLVCRAVVVDHHPNRVDAEMRTQGPNGLCLGCLTVVNW